MLPAAVVEREPVVTGKPSPFLLSDIIAKHNCVPHKMIMVGDRLDTDILWGRNTGMATLLVMTGVCYVTCCLCYTLQHIPVAPEQQTWATCSSH